MVLKAFWRRRSLHGISYSMHFVSGSSLSQNNNFFFSLIFRMYLLTEIELYRYLNDNHISSINWITRLVFENETDSESPVIWNHMYLIGTHVCFTKRYTLVDYKKKNKRRICGPISFIVHSLNRYKCAQRATGHIPYIQSSVRLYTIQRKETRSR